jgi:hypothetical protein
MLIRTAQKQHFMMVPAQIFKVIFLKILIMTGVNLMVNNRCDIMLPNSLQCNAEAAATVDGVKQCLLHLGYLAARIKTDPSAAIPKTINVFDEAQKDSIAAMFKAAEDKTVTT